MSAATHGAGAPGHPDPKTYAKIAALLCIITFGEFVIFYLEFLKPVLVPLLIVLSAAKFAMVVMFYMHLKFDHQVFTRLLLSGLVVGAGVLFGLMALFFISHPLIQTM